MLQWFALCQSARFFTKQKFFLYREMLARIKKDR